MKYTVEIDINKPIDEVIKLFDDPANLYNWMEGLQSIEKLSGEPGAVGSKSIYKFKMDKREVVMTETIIENNLPKELITSYEAKGVYNIVSNGFEKIDDQRTKYISKQEFRLKGFMKIIGFLMPGSFKKQSITYLKAFKQFAEQH